MEEESIKVRNIDFAEFLAYEDVFSTLSNASKESMNALVVFDAKERDLYFLIEESASYAYTLIKADIDIPEGYVEWDKDTQRIYGVGISSELLFYTLAEYSVEERKGVVFEINFGASGGFLIRMGQDKVSLPAKFLTASKLDVTFATILCDTIPDEPVIFQISQFGEGRGDFLKGISTSAKFLSKDEKKNNAFAIYDDKIIVNDRRHIFIYRYDKPVGYMPQDQLPICIHKQSARVFTIMATKGLVFDAVMVDKTRVYLSSGKFTAVINNAIAHIVPPSVATLEKLKPDIHVATVTAGSLSSIGGFFLGFYRGNAEFRPITLEVVDSGLKLLLRDSGVSGSSTCNVEKVLECDLFEGAHANNPTQTTILNDSLLTYVKDFDSKEFIDIYMKSGKDIRAIFLNHPKKSVYLAITD